MLKTLITALSTVAFAGASYAYQSVGGRVLDSAGTPIQLRGVNWNGFETQSHVIDGLWRTGWRNQISQMKSQGVNAVRLPFCAPSLRGTTTGYINPDLNPDLTGLNSVQIMDKMIRELSAQGFYIQLDHHSSDCGSGSPYWYSSDYPEQQWLDDLTLAANLFSGIPRVIGIDIKNEPYAATWATGNVGTDWNLAAERAAANGLAAAPHWLIFVGGLNENPNCSSQWGHFWGGNLEPLKCVSLNIPANRLVLAPHTYGPDQYPMSYFNDPTFPANMPAVWDMQFGQYAAAGYTVVVNEFGGKYGQKDPRDKVWHDAFVNYLISRGMTSSFYWAWSPSSGDIGGILNPDYTTLRTDKIAMLTKLWKAGTPAVATTPFTVRTLITNDWGYGYCTDVRVTNTSASAATWNLKTPVIGRVDNVWNADWSQTGDALSTRGVSWNGTLAPGGVGAYGFCATR